MLARTRFFLLLRWARPTWNCNSHIAQYLIAWYGLASTSLA